MNLAPLLDADKNQELERFGEDGWALVRVIEECFDIVFTADDLIAAATIGDLGERILGKLKGTQTEHCLSAVVFYRLRRTLIEFQRLQREDVRPNTRLDRLFPWDQRRSRWCTFAERSGLRLPALTYPSWVIGAALLGSTATAWAFARSFSKISNSGLPTLGLWIFSFVVLGWLAHPLARAFPRSCDRVGGLVRIVVAKNYAKLASELGPCSAGELSSVLRQLIAVEVGCELTGISESTAFPEGLKID